MQRNFTFQGHLAYSVLPLVTIFAAIILILAISHIRDIAEEQVREEHFGHLKSVNDQIDSHFLSLRQQVASIAQNAIVVNGIVDIEDRDNYIPLFIESLAIAGVPDAKIAYTDYAGRPISQNFSESLSSFFAVEDWRDHVLEEGKPYFLLDESGLTIVSPVYFSNNPEGAIAVYVQNSQVNSLFKNEGLSINTFLVNARGTILLSSDTQKGPLGTKPNLQKSNSFYLERPFEMSYQSNLTLISKESLASALELSNRLEVSLLTTVGVLYIGLVLSIVVISRKSGKTLSNLSEAISSVKSSGDLSKRIQEEGPKELVDLGFQFNDMLTQLQKSTFSKQRVSAIFDSMKELLVVTNFDGVIVQTNQAAELFANSKDIDISHDGFKLLGFDLSHRMFNGRSDVEEYLTELKYDDEHVLLNWRRSLLRSSSGIDIGYVFIGSDITTIIDAQEILRVRTKAIDAAKNGITIADASKPDLPLIYVNEAFEKLSGYSKEEVLGINCRFLQGPDTDQPAVTELRQAIKNADPCSTILKNYTKAGEAFWCELSITPVFDDKGVLSHYLGIQTDVTERVEYEDLLKDAKAKAESANQAKDDFLSTMSHEIRTPMNGVIGMAEMLSHTQLDSKQSEYVSTIVDSSKSLVSIINDILDFSKIESGKLELEAIDFDIIKSSHDVLALFAEQSKEKLLHLLLEIGPEVPAIIKGDSGRLRQVMVNLVGNAIKFTESGHVKLKIALDGNNLRVEVQDTGIGIKDEVKEKLFKPFTQADSSTTRVFGGTGLGLSISKRLIELMSGEIGIDSKEGKGSTFWFSIPCNAPIIPNAIRPNPSADEEKIVILSGYSPGTALTLKTFNAWGMHTEIIDIVELDNAENKGSPALIIADLQDNKNDLPKLKEIINQNNAKLLVLANPFDNRSDFDLDQLKGVAFLNKPWSPNTLSEAIEDFAHGNTGKPNQSDTNTGNLHHRLKDVYSSKRILVVDDTLVNQKVVESMMLTIGIQVDLANNGKEAISAVENKDYDLVFMDCLMPEMDGYQATKEIRLLGQKGKQLTIIALTANVMKSAKDKCLAAGMDDFISKPIEMEALFNILEKWLAPNENGKLRATTSSPDSEHGSTVNGSEPNVSEQPVLDEHIIEAMGPAVKQIFGEVVKTGLHDIQKQLNIFETQLDEPDSTVLIRCVHSIKSCSAQVGSKDLTLFAKEKELQYNEGDFAGVENDFDKLNLKYGQLKASLANYMQNQTNAQ